jgi:hypothetical protein
MRALATDQPPPAPCAAAHHVCTPGEDPLRTPPPSPTKNGVERTYTRAREFVHLGGGVAVAGGVQHSLGNIHHLNRAREHIQIATMRKRMRTYVGWMRVSGCRIGSMDMNLANDALGISSLSSGPKSYNERER